MLVFRKNKCRILYGTVNGLYLEILSVFCLKTALVEEQLSDGKSTSGEESVLVLDYGKLYLACNIRSAHFGDSIFQHLEFFFVVKIEVVKHYLLRVGGEIKIVEQNSCEPETLIDDLYNTLVALVIGSVDHFRGNVVKVSSCSGIKERSLLLREYLFDLAHSCLWCKLVLHAATPSALTYRVGVRIDYHFIHEVGTVVIGNDRLVEVGNNKVDSLSVVKKGNSKVETEIDGVTGATLTSNGVGAMVTEGLNAYKEFLNK